MVKWWLEPKVLCRFLYRDLFHPKLVLICASISSFCWLSVKFHFRHCFSLWHCWMHYFGIIIIIPIDENFIIRSCCYNKLSWSRRASVILITNNYIVFLYFCFLVPNLKLTILIPQSKCFICARRVRKLLQVLFSNISYEYVHFFVTIIIIGCYGRKFWKCSVRFSFLLYLVSIRLQGIF